MRVYAFSCERDSLPQVPHSRTTDSQSQLIGSAIATQKGKLQALAAIADFLNEAKKDGTVRKALGRGGFDDPVAP